MDRMEVLFQEWANKQCDDLDCPEELINSFCRDGVTSLAGNVPNIDSEVELLFILKEANTRGVPRADYFWFNEDINNSTRMKYASRFKLVMDKLGIDNSCKFGYMNLNKHGGYGHCNYSQLCKYVFKYREQILKQIHIFNPEVVIFFGCYYRIAKILFPDVASNWNGQPVQPMNERFKIYYLYHPSYYRFNALL